MSNTRQASNGVFDVDALVAESTLESFRFTLGGKERTLPHFSTLSLEQGQQLEDGEIGDLFSEISGDDDLGTLFVKLPGFASNKIIEKWADHAGVRLGDTRRSRRS